jgi:uncharacterized protein with HEPN domain
MLLDNDQNRLKHILVAAMKAIAFAEGRQQAELKKDEQFLFAVIRCLEIIGEAAARMSNDVRENHPDIPWQRMIGTRNRLIHAYFDVDVDVVWKTVTEELPYLIRQIEKLLANSIRPNDNPLI